MGNGASGMYETIMVTVLVAAMCALIRVYGGFDALLALIRRIFKGKKGGQLGMGLLVGAMDIATANNTVAIVMANKWKWGKFKYIRICTDLVCVILGCVLFVAAGNPVGKIPTIAGVGTIITAFFMGPLIEYFNDKIARPFLNKANFHL